MTALMLSLMLAVTPAKDVFTYQTLADFIQCLYSYDRRCAGSFLDEHRDPEYFSKTDVTDVINEPWRGSLEFLRFDTDVFGLVEIGESCIAVVDGREIMVVYKATMLIYFKGPKIIGIHYESDRPKVCVNGQEV